MTPKEMRYTRNWGYFEQYQWVFGSYADGSLPTANAGLMFYNSTKNVPQYYGGASAEYYPVAAVSSAVSSTNQLMVGENPSTNAYALKPWAGGSAGFVKINSSNVVSIAATVDADEITTADLESATLGDTIGETGGLLGAADHLVTAKAVKDYVDASNAGSLEFIVNGATGTVGEIDLDTERLDFVGTSNEVTVAIPDGANSNRVQFSLPDSINVQHLIWGTANDDHNIWTSCTGTIYVGSSSSTMTVNGNLTVLGTTTTVESTTLEVADSLIQLAKNQTSADSLPIGFYGTYNDTNTYYPAMIRPNGTDRFVLYNTTSEPTGNSYTFESYMDMQVADIYCGSPSTDGTAPTTGYLYLYNAGHQYYTRHAANAGNSANLTFTWPSAYASSASMCLVGDTSGNLSWSTAASLFTFENGIGESSGTVYLDITSLTTTATEIDTSDKIAFSDESVTNEPTKAITFDHFVSQIWTNIAGNDNEVCTFTATSIEGQDTFKYHVGSYDGGFNVLQLGKTSSYGTLRLYGPDESAQYIQFKVADDAGGTGATQDYVWPSSATAGAFLKCTNASTGALAWDTSAGDIIGTKEITFLGSEAATGWYDDTAVNNEYTITLVNSGHIGNGQQSHGLGTGTKFAVQVFEYIDATTYRMTTEGIVVDIVSGGDIVLRSGSMFQGKVNLIAMDT